MSRDLCAEFIEFDRSHPDVYRLFCDLTLQLIRSGRESYGAHSVLHRIRWHYATSSQGEAFKINNNFSAFYSRKFAKDYPDHAAFFDRRTSVADECPV